MPATGAYVTHRAEVINWSPDFMSQETPNSGNDENFRLDFGDVAQKVGPYMLINFKVFKV